MTIYHTATEEDYNSLMIELEKQGFVGCSYLLNKNINLANTCLKNREDRETSDLFEFTDVNEINEGWIINKRHFQILRKSAIKRITGRFKTIMT